MVRINKQKRTEQGWGNTGSIKAEREEADMRHEEVEACTYWARRGRERGPPSRNPQRSARCWTWWRLQRRQHSDQTPAWKAPRESTLGVDQTLRTEGEKTERERCSKVFRNCHKMKKKKLLMCSRVKEIIPAIVSLSLCGLPGLRGGQ